MATVKQLRQAARKAGFRGPALLVAVAIALAESEGNEGARHVNTNGSVDFGAWQINSIHSDILKHRNPYDLQTNADMAFEVYKRAGKKFTPWVTYNSGSYKQHLTAAQTVTDPSLGGLVDPHHSTPVGTGVDYTGVPHGLNAVGEGLGIIAGGAGDAVSALNPIHDLNSLIGAISEGAFWKRVGLGFLAFLLLIVALVIMVESTKTGRAITADATKAAVV